MGLFNLIKMESEGVVFGFKVYVYVIYCGIESKDRSSFGWWWLVCLVFLFFFVCCFRMFFVLS